MDILLLIRLIKLHMELLKDNKLGYKVSDGQVIPIGNVKFIDWPGGEPLGDAGRYKRVDVAGGRRTVWKKV